jgi:hypothetical protein
MLATVEADAERILRRMREGAIIEVGAGSRLLLDLVTLEVLEGVRYPVFCALQDSERIVCSYTSKGMFGGAAGAHMIFRAAEDAS